MIGVLLDCPECFLKEFIRKFTVRECLFRTFNVSFKSKMASFGIKLKKASGRTSGAKNDPIRVKTDLFSIRKVAKFVKRVSLELNEAFESV